MSRADLIAKRDAAAVIFERVDAYYQCNNLPIVWRALEEARAARTAAQDAVDAADKVTS